MRHWAQQHRQMILNAAMVLLLATVGADCLAALKVLPVIRLDHLSILTVVLVLGTLPSPGKQPPPRNWVARHRGWATLIGVGLLVGMIWVGQVLQEAWGTPLAARLLPDLLVLLAFGFWASSWFRSHGPMSPA